MITPTQTLKSVVDQKAVVHAYRHLYRQGLKAINYSTPARHVLRHSLRSAFRSSSPEELNPRRIANTLQFLQRAADVAGLEHKIVKNLMMMKYWEQPQVRKDHRTLRGLGVDQRDPILMQDTMRQFNLTLSLLNDSLDICLR
ncbi:DUF1763-domain-containing protein [Aspergillus costaricaensis CBS 115574]|nr:DUF1763-domain-containing protein [Aspergillus eucalypticola CBS 122712]XP_025544445.1 DUF1763-domain-containing protein [Aspergillus costaricaensis CBS 115574]PWY67477.1 DUF1763-domain-containing protein [Aspergillus eucalypticola CBS 122712]RAK93610.1 DUF1763-domain-containing protein [Aspergillus costaricaensis CBS 115574]